MVYLTLISVIYIYLYNKKYIIYTPYIITNFIFLLNLICIILIYSSINHTKYSNFILFNLYVYLYMLHTYTSDPIIILLYLLVSDIVFEKISKGLFVTYIPYTSRYYDLCKYNPNILAMNDIILEPNKHIVIHTGIQLKLPKNSCYFLKIYYNDMFLISNSFTNEEIKFYLFNNTSKTQCINKNTTIAKILGISSLFKKCVFVKKNNIF